MPNVKHMAGDFKMKENSKNRPNIRNGRDRRRSKKDTQRDFRTLFFSCSLCWRDKKHWSRLTMARRRAASIQYEQTYKHILKKEKGRKCRFPIPASDSREMSPAKHLSKLVMPDEPWNSLGLYQLRHRDGLFGSRTPQ